jgi:hypothetical protein
MHCLPDNETLNECYTWNKDKQKQETKICPRKKKILVEIENNIILVNCKN